MSNFGNIKIFLTILVALTFSAKCLIATNDRPILGILMQELSGPMRENYNHTSYIAASYVKFIEGAGGRVVPIWTGKSERYYRRLLRKINGVLLPGGGASFDNSGGYADAGYKIYQIAKELNEQGDYFPIFGICLGFELLTYVAANKVKHRRSCTSQGQALPLNFKRVHKISRLFGNAPPDIIDILGTEEVTINFHKFCTTEKALKTVGLSDEFRVLSTNIDENDEVQFISSLEHNRFPFYGLQFHPEKNLYEWIKKGSKRNIPHTANAVKVGQYFANFFVNEARKSTHRFENQAEEDNILIYNYCPTYTALRYDSSFEQCYLFYGIYWVE